MPKMEEKILTRTQVKKLGLDKIPVITDDMLDGYTGIGANAFACCDRLASITIPSSITSIGYLAFAYCSRLSSIDIPSSVTRFGNGVFYCCGLTSVNLPNSITSIGDSTFYGCDNLSSIDIPSGVTSIDKDAFACCNSLTSITIPSGVTSIGNRAFYNCRYLTSVSIPNSVTSIGVRAFCNCRRLLSITIPNSVTNIGWYAFYKCNLESMSIHGVEYKAQVVANGKCKAYKGFNSNMMCRDFKYKEEKTYKFDGKIELCKCGFHACLDLKSVFNYYCGGIGKDFVIHEVELENVSKERHDGDSKVVAKKITIGKRIL